MTTKEYLIARKSKDWKYNRVVDAGSFLHVNKIHPIKQKLVKEIVNVAQEDTSVRKIIIFGSSTRYDCDITSDLDICVDWAEDCYDSDGVLKPFTYNFRKAISLITKGRADVVNYGYLSGTVLEEAVKEGILVYDCPSQGTLRI